MLSADTIVAPATPPGEGGVGIIRLSGPEALSSLDAVFRGKARVVEMDSRRLYRGVLVNSQNQSVDEVLAVVMRAPNSYTGEDVVEVHCHGGTQIMRTVLDLFLAQGARMAHPGEFTQRAFINGKLDLAQAEAVVEVIKARSDKASRIALDQLGGRLSQKVHQFAERLRDALALLEAHIDFPDDEVGELDLRALLQSVDAVAQEMSQLTESFDLGRALREGISILILGRPNVGKSSLMNAILGESRAIVTDVAGTTRDTLEEQLVLAGFPVRLIDAAGVRDTQDPVELEGVRRARDKALAADLVLLVVDGSLPLSEEDRLALELCDPHNTLLVVNKCDQAQVCDMSAFGPFLQQVNVSAKYDLGLDLLRDAIVAQLGKEAALADTEGLVINERRHRDALNRGLEAVTRLQGAAGSGAPLECLAMELREVLSALGEITGETTPDEILEQIFNRFCIGK